MLETKEDILLRNCLADKVEQFRQNINDGRPYVWELRLSMGEFCKIETAIANSIFSHSGDYHHLLSEEYAVIVVIYLAEWYKRFYKGIYNPQIEMFARFKMKSSFHKTKRII